MSYINGMPRGQSVLFPATLDEYLDENITRKLALHESSSFDTGSESLGYFQSSAKRGLGQNTFCAMLS